MTAIQSFRAFRGTIRASFAAAFRMWAYQEAEEWRQRYPDREPFDVDKFDGCTGPPDICRPCCFVHDLGCHYARTYTERRKADAEMRRCMADMADTEAEPWSKAYWHCQAWKWWAAVSARTLRLHLTGKLP
jgi:hypothetical protein